MHHHTGTKNSNQIQVLSADEQFHMFFCLFCDAPNGNKLSKKKDLKKI